MQPVRVVDETAVRGAANLAAESAAVISIAHRGDSAYAPPAVNSPTPVDPETLWPTRFWDETLSLLPMFERLRNEDDDVNALASFSRLAQYRYRETSTRPGYERAKKSVVSAFQPKSGGTYLHNRMLQMGYQDFWWFYPSRLSHSVCYASDVALELFMLGGCTCHSHARPDPNVLAAFDRAGVEKVWVHLRNPAEAAVSSYHHYLGEGHGDGEIGAQRRREALETAALAGMTPEMHKSAWVIDSVGWYVDWIAAWLKYANHRAGLVAFTYYTELADPHALVRRAFGELGVDLSGNFSADQSADDRFRQKAAADWRDGMSAAAVECVERRVRAGLQDYPQFARLWS